MVQLKLSHLKANPSEQWCQDSGAQCIIIFRVVCGPAQRRMTQVDKMMAWQACEATHSSRYGAVDRLKSKKPGLTSLVEIKIQRAEKSFPPFLTILTLKILPWSETNAGYFPKQMLSGIPSLILPFWHKWLHYRQYFRRNPFQWDASEARDNCMFPELHFGFKDVWEGLTCSKIHVSYSMHYSHLGYVFSRYVFMCMILCECI